MGQVPTHLMDSNRDAKGFGHGKGYQYPHDFPGHFVAQQYLPDHLVNTDFYKPSQEGYEAKISDRISEWRKQQTEALENQKKGK